MSKFILTAFEVGECGWYARGNDEPSAIGTTGEVFGRLAAWVKGQTSIENTRFSFREGRRSAPVYAFDVAEKDGDRLVTLWLDKSRDASQEVLGLNVKQPPDGSGEVQSKKFDKGYIPGFPVYFFIVPSADRVYSVKPESYQVAGHPEFDSYVQSFIAKHTGESKPSTDARGMPTTRYGKKDGDGEDLNPRFSSQLKKRAQKGEDLIRRVSDIRKLVSVRDLKNQSAAKKKEFIDWILEGFDIGVKVDDVDNVKRARCEVDVELTREKLERILESNAPGERVGFIFRNESQVKWTDEYIDRTERELNVNPENGVFNAADLLEALARQKQSLLS